jgi:glycosyltransferase involved in cell wall biosynthesis
MASPSCVIIIENLSAPSDRRVWQEALALHAAGWTVSIICPRSDKHPEAYEALEGIEIHRHPAPFEAKGKLGFLVEYVWALVFEFIYLIRVYRHRGFDVIQACNPPDLIFLVALPFKLIGKRFVFDHHDVNPELYVAKFKRKGLFHRLLLLAERLTFRCADLVISANETYRRIAIERGGKRPEDVVTVYSVPDTSRFYRVPANPALRGEARIVLGYVGVIAEQDGVDNLVAAMDELVNRQGYRDIRAVIVGDGTELATLREQCRRLGLDGVVTFTGFLSGDELRAALSSFDIGIIPDPVNAYNDKISMNKVFEYSTLGIPSVSFDLSETRRLLGDVGTYATQATPQGLAEACRALIDDEALRLDAGRRAKARADERFVWAREAETLVAGYDRVKPARA